MYEFDDFDDDDEGGPRRWLWVAAIALVALVFGGIVMWSSSGDTVAFPTTTTTETNPSTTDPTVVDESTPATTTEGSTSSAIVSPVTTSTPASTPASTSAPTAAPTAAPTVPATSPATGATPAPVVPTAVARAPSYPVEPDGMPVPIRVAFGRETISITGFAPSDDAVQRLSRFAVAYSKSPDATVVADVTIDSTVPTTVGVRFVELDSVRFRAGSTDVSADHAPEFDRIVGVLNLLPNTSLVVLGHANWPSDQEKNFALASARALSVTAYIVGQGIDPSRVSARSGEATDLLSTADTEQALALNRRTEFIFSGLLT